MALRITKQGLEAVAGKDDAIAAHAETPTCAAVAPKAETLAADATCPCSNFHNAEKDWRSSRAERTVTVMVAILCALTSVGGLVLRQASPAVGGAAAWPYAAGAKW